MMRNTFRRHLCFAPFVMFLKATTLFNRRASINISATCNYESSERLFARAEKHLKSTVNDLPSWTLSGELLHRQLTHMWHQLVETLRAFRATRWTLVTVNCRVDGFQYPKWMIGREVSCNLLGSRREGVKMTSSTSFKASLEFSCKSECKPIKAWLIDAPRQSVEKKFNLTKK